MRLKSFIFYLIVASKYLLCVCFKMIYIHSYIIFLPIFAAEKNPTDHTLASVCSRISVGSWLESGILQGWLSTHLLASPPTSEGEATPTSWQLLRTLTAYIITQHTQNAEVRFKVTLHLVLTKI